MTPSQKSKLVKRLRELADGAEPKERAYGICDDVFSTSIRTGKVLSKVLIFLTDDDWPIGNIGLGIDMWQGDWGNDRRTLAGILAAYIEVEY